MSSAAYSRLRGIFKSSTATATVVPTSNYTATATVVPTSNSTSTTTTTTTTTKIVKEKIKRPKKLPTVPTTTAPAAVTTIISRPNNENLAFQPLPMSQLTASLGNLRSFIDQFKRASNLGPFRYSYKYYDDVVSHLARAKQHSYIEEILEHQKRYKTDMSNEAFVARLISLYGKSRMYDHARKLFDEMPELNCPRTVLSANALLTACVNSKKLNEMSELFRELRDEFSIDPDDVSYNIVIKAFCEMDATDSALLIANEMEKNGFKCNLYTYNTILDALYAEGNISEADKLWDEMKSKNLEPDVRTYNSKIRGLIIDKRITEAIGLLDEMKNKGVNPDVYTYNGLIHGFVKEDDLVEVKKWYRKMVENGVVPDSVTFRIIIPFASKKGDYKFGFDLSKEGLRMEINVGRLSLQGVLDGLVKESAIDEAKELVELVKGSDFIYYKLKVFNHSKFGG
ncbi:unnamed protein product [Lactuca virosa]|uniref:Pentacotripeptide-repeat region of PRORP domain-containing protein n=1 Tax=Lactuca virosa TaxID=75947 RepID=A0AAU9N7D0_9ASTR|nr:unnamed protein product [Lactuca virosa]